MAEQTAKTTTKNNKNNNNLIIGICAAIAAVVIIAVIVIVLIMNKGKGGLGGINDSYFVSDDTKYVLNLDADDIYVENTEYAPLKSHLVYTYSDDAITGLKAYYEYSDNSSAEAAYNFYQENNDNTYKEVALDGKYLILTANEDEYQNLSPSDVKQQIEFMEMLNNMNTDDLETVEEAEGDGASAETDEAE